VKLSLYDQIIDNLSGVKQYRNYITGLCPFHSDHKNSLKVSTKGFRCWGCGKFGTHKTLLRALQRQGANVIIVDDPISYRQQIFPPYWEFIALLELLTDAHDRLVATERLMWYPSKRGIKSMVIPCQIGWHNEWYTFPITNADGEIRGAVGRAGSQVQSPNKYTVPDQQPPLLYIPDHILWRSASIVFITFGIIDAISLSMLGFAAGTPSNGQYNVNPDWFAGLMKPIYIVPDRGEKSAAVRLACQLGWRGKIIELDYPDGIKDPNDWFCQDKELLKRNIHRMSK